MKIRSQIATAQRGRRWLALGAIVWVLTLLTLMGWWGLVVRQQSEKILELQRLAGISETATEASWHATQRMLAWEGGTLLLLLAGLTIALAWLYVRDQRRTNSLRAFFASVTHELRTPLTSIRLQAESLADAGSNSPLLERLLEDSNRLEAQVEKTLELARLEGGGRLDLQALPIRAWLQRQLQSSAAGRSISVELWPADLLPDALVLADRAALEIILRNLIENTVRHSRRTPAKARITAREQDSGLLVAFVDEGEGFGGDPAQLGSLFVRGERSRGAGVGLYLIRSLMQRMGGRAEFSTRAGSGFESVLYFQRAEESA